MSDLFADLQGNEAQPPIVLLHGFGGFHRVWDEVRRELGPDFRTIAYDLPGHGASLGLRDAVSAKRASAAILADMAERAPGPFHLVGHSMGGAVAALMAMSQPERIASLNLLAPGGFGETISEPLLARFAAARTRDELAAALAPMGHPLHRVEAADLDALARTRLVPGQTELLIELAATISRGGRQGAIPREQLAALMMPVTVVWGDDDAVLDPRHADDLPAHFTLRRVPDTGHMLPEEQPRLVADILRASVA
ncbi:alpha/beta fold hydrolase [Arvimicrobium flavum]|uniref:alpha/beta fold hydrolase n=1 Tax=Arvimicrobium flavum TaxID=3393320 RepID=UPI00237BB2D0|nr:alpha/beta fold hydrolase [Mesorhizobium shangrilense]